MKVGDYVRTKDDGYINKIKKVNQYNVLVDGRDLFGEEICVPNNEIAKSSPNIIDLLEDGDYVNGYKIVVINGIKHIETKNGLEFFGIFWMTNIKSIVTKEQFEAMEYKLCD